MTTHWMKPCKPVPPALTRPGPEHAGRFELDFLRHGPRTAIGRQRVSYPFHLTRPFLLDRLIPSLLTVYQQSSSGGVYRADLLSCRYRVRAGAAAHVTTQAATIVHDCRGSAAMQAVSVALEDDAFLALTPDPLILFPGASVALTLEATVAPTSVLLVGESFAMHDPHASGRVFDQLSSDLTVQDVSKRLLVRDAFQIAGADLLRPASPIGQWRLVSNFLLVGPPSRLPDKSQLTDLAGQAAAVVGIGLAPNRAGWGIRCLAADAVAARHVAETLFSRCAVAAFGEQPAVRRK